MTDKSPPLFVFMAALILFPYNVIGGRDCYDLIDIVHIQDVSSSFHPFLPDLAARIGSAITLIGDTVPDAHFGFATFSDKRISGINPKTNQAVTLGAATDYCLRVDQPLRRPDVPKMVKLFQELQSKPVGGGDTHAGVYEALYRAVTASNLLWRREPPGGKKVGRFIILVTGSPSHLPGDVFNLTGKTVRPFDITPYKIRDNRNRANYDCDKVDYPTIEQVAKLINRLKDTLVVILAAPGGTLDSNHKFQPYPSVAALDSHYHSEGGLARWYRKQLDDAGLGKVRVHPLDEGMFLYNHAILEIVSGREKSLCHQPKQRETNW